MLPLFDDDTSTGVPEVSTTAEITGDCALVLGDSAKVLKQLPDDSVQLILSSPPYNIGKEYEEQRALEAYIEDMKPVFEQLVRVLRPGGSLCWQVGNFVHEAEVFPLDLFFYPILKQLGLRLRNRIVWTFDHGLHASKRLSGRYETLLWFTLDEPYVFNLDPIRVPSKYPGKLHFKGPKIGQPSGNPLGKNPSDVGRFLQKEMESGIWEIPNVKANHPEKTSHPCQFPIELVERCVLAFSSENDLVLDPYCGSGSTVVGARKLGRRALGIDREAAYLDLARSRLADLAVGRLRYRELGKPVHQPNGREAVSQRPASWGPLPTNS